MAATIKYFGRFPTTIVLCSSSQFNGSAQTSAPVLSPGVYTFPVQAGGGLYAFHDIPVEIKQVTYSGGGTCTITKAVGTVGSPIQQTVLATLNTTTPVDYTNFYLSPGEHLLFSTTGATNPVLAITAHEATYAADGGG